MKLDKVPSAVLEMEMLKRAIARGEELLTEINLTLAAAERKQSGRRAELARQKEKNRSSSVKSVKSVAKQS